MRQQHHDALTRLTFSHLPTLRAHLEGALPRKVLDRLDLSTLTPVRETTVDPGLGRRSNDLLFELRTVSGERCRLLLLFEHQRKPDRLLSWRCMRYLVREWDQDAERWKAERKKGPWQPSSVIVLVVYNGITPWTVPRCLRDLLLEEADREALGAYQADLPLQVLDLGRTPDEAIPGGAAGRLALLAMKMAAQAGGWDQAVRWGRLWQEARALRGLDFIRAILNYIGFTTRQPPSPPVQQAIAEAAGQDSEEEVFMGWLHKVENEARAKGKEEGQLEAQRRILTLQIERRFGPLSPASLQRIEEGTSENLDRWLLRVIDAESIEQVFDAV